MPLPCSLFNLNLLKWHCPWFQVPAILCKHSCLPVPKMRWAKKIAHELQLQAFLGFRIWCELNQPSSLPGYPNIWRTCRSNRNRHGCCHWSCCGWRCSRCLENLPKKFGCLESSIFAYHAIPIISQCFATLLSSFKFSNGIFSNATWILLVAPKSKNRTTWGGVQSLYRRCRPQTAKGWYWKI